MERRLVKVDSCICDFCSNVLYEGSTVFVTLDNMNCCNTCKTKADRGANKAKYYNELMISRQNGIEQYNEDLRETL